MAHIWDGDVVGGEDAVSLATTWLEVRMPLRTRRMTVTSPSGSDHYLGRDQTDGGAVSAGSHSANVGGSPFPLWLGPPTTAELALGYRPIYIALASGTGTGHVRSEVG